MASRGRALSNYLRQFDWLMTACLMLLVGLSLVLHYSIAVGREGGDLSAFTKQLVIAILGFAVFFAVSAVDYHVWRGLSLVVYVGMISLLVGVVLFGQTVNGTRGWIGFGSLRFQPVELAKFTTVIVLATFFARRARELNRLPNLIASFFGVGVLAALTLLQPDFGSAAVLVALWAALVLTIGVRRKYLIAISVVAIVGFAVAWLFLFKPYQKERIRAIIEPAKLSDAATYNVRQAIIAVGSGGVFGRGLGEGSQSQLRFLPEASTDFIFAVLGEELGFVGIAMLFIVLGVLYMRLFRLLFHCRDEFASFVVLGTVLLLAIQISVSAGMAMGLVPVVGIPFPFLSAGGSALLVHLLLLGVVASIARSERLEGYRLSQVTTA